MTFPRWGVLVGRGSTARHRWRKPGRTECGKPGDPSPEIEPSEEIKICGTCARRSRTPTGRDLERDARDRMTRIARPVLDDWISRVSPENRAPERLRVLPQSRPRASRALAIHLVEANAGPSYCGVYPPSDRRTKDAAGATCLVCLRAARRLEIVT